MHATTDASATTGLTEAVHTVLPALEQFLGFEARDLAATEYERWRAALSEPLPERGTGARSTLEILGRVVIPHGVRIGAPGFSGWVNTTPTIVPTVAAFTASIAGAQRVWLQSFNFLEYLALEWLKQLLGLPPSSQGIFSSGGSVANLIALGAARQWACEQRGIDASRDGLQALQNPRLYASDEVHHVVHRAAAVLGLGRRALVQLPTDDAFRLNVSALRAKLRQDRADGCMPIAVIASAGTVNTGAIDPLREIAQLCRQERVWLHVDGAYGGFGILDPEVRPWFESLSEADSIAVDPHKWLAVPLGCGATFVRDRELLGRAFTSRIFGRVSAPTRINRLAIRRSGPYFSPLYRRTISTVARRHCMGRAQGNGRGGNAGTCACAQRVRPPPGRTRTGIVSSGVACPCEPLHLLFPVRATGPARPRCRDSAAQ